MQQAALQIPFANAELRRCEQGCIKHGRRASQGADSPEPSTGPHSSYDFSS